MPPALRELYLRLGNCAPLMKRFNTFLAPEEWSLLQGRMMFLNENQGVCQWLVDAAGGVWMRMNEEIHPENLKLDEFLGVLMPYQLAQGGWDHCADLVLSVEELAAEREAIAGELGWPLLVNHNGLTIYGQGAGLLWSLTPVRDDADGHLFVSCLRRADLDDLCERFGFVDLD